MTDPSTLERLEQHAVARGALRHAALAAIIADTPQAPEVLARHAGVAADEAAVVLALLTEAGAVTFDDGGRIDGIAGLTRRPMPHRIERGRDVLHTWCAFDAAGIPAAARWDVRPAGPHVSDPA